MKTKHIVWVGIALVIIIALAAYFAVRLDNQVAVGTVPPINVSPQSLTQSGAVNTFSDGTKTISFMYPNQFIASTGAGMGNNLNADVTAGSVLGTVTIPASYIPKTNFQGAELSVITSSDPKAVAACEQANPNTGTGVESQTVIQGVPFKKFITSDAGAGNFYEMTSYRTVKNNTCYMIEYTIHSTNIGNYSPDQGITAFDHTSIVNLLDGIVSTFKILK